MTADITRTFTDSGDFVAYNAAVSFLRARCFSVGPMQGEHPVGALFGTNIVVAKWRNLSSVHRAKLHGIITGESKRNGPITVTIFAHAPAAARAAVSSSKAA